MRGRHGHEGLFVYRRALEAARWSHHAATEVGVRRADLRDQLMRASASVVLNIAEGAGEFSGPEKARFYRMAKRSASECAAILDVLEATIGLPETGREARAAIAHVAAMLVPLISAHQRRP